MSRFDWPSFLLSFDGRVSRGDYWLRFILPFCAISMALGILTMILGDLFAIIQSLFFLSGLWPALAIGVKRWHDRGKSGWWMLVVLVPIIGSIYAFIECGCLRGVPEANRFGPDPLSAA